MQAAMAASLVLPNVLSLNWMPEMIETGDPGCWLASKLPEGALTVEILDSELQDPLEWQCKRLSAICGQFVDQQRARRLLVKLGASEQEVADLSQTGSTILVHDANQNFTLEVWEQDFSGGHLLGKSRPTELRKLFMAESEHFESELIVIGGEPHLKEGASASKIRNYHLTKWLTLH